MSEQAGGGATQVPFVWQVSLPEEQPQVEHLLINDPLLQYWGLVDDEHLPYNVPSEQVGVGAAQLPSDWQFWPVGQPQGEHLSINVPLLQYLGLDEVHCPYGVLSGQVEVVVLPPPLLLPPPPPPVPVLVVVLVLVLVSVFVVLVLVLVFVSAVVLVLVPVSVVPPELDDDALSFLNSSLSLILVFAPTKPVAMPMFSSLPYFCWNLVTAVLVFNP